MSRSTVLVVHTGSGRQDVTLSSYLDGTREEHASARALAWIKQLRHARVEGQPLRERFTMRGDSLWWFAELYLHKRPAILSIFRTLAALDRLAAQQRPLEIQFVSGEHAAAVTVRAFARARGIPYRGPATWAVAALRLARLDVRARSLMLAAMTSRLRRASVPARTAGVAVAAFVHRAFWRPDAGDAEAESYIGPVLAALEARLSKESLAYVGVGPSHNFRARRWWHALRGRATAPTVQPVESFAPLAALRDSRAIWRLREPFRRMLWRSDDLREHAVIDGCDCWPIVREELAGVAWLQWPWSARAMDEAGAALDALDPGVVLTYAEAGGWGRAIMLEARRRNVPSVGLQHGFIYRHWLNYRHEPDEMRGAPSQPGDAGFPRPTVTLVFDGYAARHLAEAGQFPADAIEVTGSPRLDALAAAAARVDAVAIARARASAGAAPTQMLMLVVSKFREAQHVLPSLLAAAATHPEVQVAIKAHPAETADVYRDIVAGHTNVRVLPASEPLGPLLQASRAIVTVNSTVALDAAVLGIPALVIGLPNNLSPFVDAGIFAGAGNGPAIEANLTRILYDEEFRQQLEKERSVFLRRFAVGTDGRAAERAADAILARVRTSRTTAGQEH